MRSWKLVCILLFLSLSQAFAGDILEDNTSQLLIKAPLAEGKEAIITVAELPETTPEKIQDLIANQKTKNADLLVSTDKNEVIQAVRQATSGRGDKRLVRFIPIGKIAAAGDTVASGFKQYYQNARTTLMHDRIGLTVLTITVGVDTMIWLHSSSLDIHQKTSMVMMNLVMAATFGLDRDLWSRTVRPTKNQLIKVFDRFLPSPRLSPIGTLTAQFLANMGLATAIQASRLSLLNLSTISSTVMTGDFWTTAVKIGALGTLTGFAWSELYGSIEAQRNPVAKMMMKRIGEVRGIILCQLASISMVLQPQIYGNTPIITFVVHGAIGLIALANAQRIVTWLENSRTVNNLYKKVQTFENFINNGLRPPRSPGPVRTCRSLFAA